MVQSKNYLPINQNARIIFALVYQSLFEVNGGLISPVGQYLGTLVPEFIRRYLSMQKNHLVVMLANELQLSPHKADLAMSAIIEHITNALSRGESVVLPGFGSFKVSERAAREGRNPRTGETIKIAASRNVAFKAGTQLKAAVNP
jgi:DNA-binding protein HU-beta